MEGVRHRFVEQAPQELATALKPVEGGLEHMGEDAAQKAQSLSAEAKQMEQWVQQAQPAVETLKGALDAVAQVG
jgi:ABC-type transporter Mla subunit MlaD